MASRSLVINVPKLYIFRNYTRTLTEALQKNLSTSVILHKTNDPIKYSTTRASQMSTSDTLESKPHPAALSGERYILLGFLAIFFIYFSCIRKENKLDKILDGSFNYPEDDEIKILNAILHAKLQGLKTDDLEKKLEIIRYQKK